ncbi:MAG: T9SS type A sorting domain-containing protein, partial [Flavobacteriaceae bacterium]|nr:T9SS type A sorting domain-containing protein [Flavobacteriaceae bacterium]
YENINKAALFIDGINISETIVNSQQITLDDFLIVIPDGEHKSFSLYVSFEETVLDNEQIIFRINETNTTSDSTPFAFRNAGGASSPTNPGVNKIQVIANQLAFIQQPTSVNLQSLMQPYPKVIAVDVFGNRDMDFNDFLTLTTTSIFAENAVTSIQSQNGQAIFDQLYFDLVGEDFLINVSSSDTEIPEKESNTFTVFDIPVIMTAGKVFITEVSDNPTSSLEYLEIFNNSGRHITLSEVKLVMYPEGTVWGFGASSGNSIPNGVIPPRGFAIISRGGLLQDFESYYGSLNSNTIFIQGTAGMFFAPENPREWKLYQGGTIGVANGHLIDQTTSFGVSNNQRISKNVFNNNFEYSNSLLANPGELDDLIFTDGNWVNDLSPDINSSGQNVYFFDDFTLSQTISSQNAGIAAPYILNLNGFDFNVSQIFTFKSNSSGSAQLDEIQANETISGQVTMERYIPARRSFRFLSSAVSTPGTIQSNWQEGAVNATSNPNPGYGTHITGSVSGLNGFDATPTGNPSLFKLNNAAQSWESVSNTDINTIVSGTPYRLMVRGDRSIDVTSNSAPPTNTVLRTTGTLHTGSFTTSDFSSTAGAFNFFGNPYPSVVDMTSVVGSSTNINTNHYYVWDPTLGGTPIPGEPGGRGAYVAVDLTSGGNNNIGSQANQYLQPGQAAFVQTLNNGGSSLTFEESHKAVSQTQTQVFNVLSQISMMLYGANNYATGATASDGLRIKFSEAGSNAVTPEDALKFYNLDENIATQNGNQLLSIESRALPEDEEVLPLFFNQYRYPSYVLEIAVNELTGVIAYLRDHYTGDQVALSNDQTTLYGFTIDPSITESIASDRFDIKFEQELLSTIDIDRSNIVLFPNPAQEVVYLIAKSMVGEQVEVWLTNMLGQRLYTKSHKINDDGIVTIDTSRLRSGVYLLELRGENGFEFKTKLIIE